MGSQIPRNCGGAGRWPKTRLAPNRCFQEPSAISCQNNPSTKYLTGRALELPRPRLLIADDVGLGKTIEAGLILRELNARRRAARILIVCPASIIEQWQTELASKFGFEFKIFDSDGVAEARRSLEAGSNPWCAEPRVIASVDFIKRREGAFRELSASRWDVIIIDEAHHLASGGNDDELTDRFRLARWLAAENTGALLLLTATPHDGYDQNFASLLSLLEPSLIIPGRILKFDHYGRHMVRRLKRHVRMPDGTLTVFQKRSFRIAFGCTFDSA